MANKNNIKSSNELLILLRLRQLQKDAIALHNSMLRKGNTDEQAVYNVMVMTLQNTIDILKGCCDDACNIKVPEEEWKQLPECDNVNWEQKK